MELRHGLAGSTRALLHRPRPALYGAVTVVSVETRTTNTPTHQNGASLESQRVYCAIAVMHFARRDKLMALLRRSQRLWAGLQTLQVYYFPLSLEKMASACSRPAVLPMLSANLSLSLSPHSPSCTMRTTPRRHRPASSPALRTRRPRPARPGPTQLHPPASLRRRRGRQDCGVRERERCLRLLMQPSTWERRLQPPVCGAVFLFVWALILVRPRHCMAGNFFLSIQTRIFSR